MGLLKLGTVSILTLLVVVNCQSEYSTTPSYRDYLFAKPRQFKRQEAPPNKTRFTDDEKKLILDVHNAYRSLVEPPATNMRELLWDDDLEDFARNHSLKCTGAHNPVIWMRKYFGIYYVTWNYLGENLYYNYGPWYSIEEAIWMFWEEGKDYDIATGNCTHKYTCGHYRVVTTANSSYVGCAMNVCDKFSVSNYPTPAVFLVCTYSGSNLVYYEPYVVGKRASQCTDAMTDDQRPYSRYGLCIDNTMRFLNTGFDGNTSIVGLPSPYITTSPTSDTTEPGSTFSSTTTYDPSTSPTSPLSTTTYDPSTNPTSPLSTTTYDPSTNPTSPLSTTTYDPSTSTRPAPPTTTYDPSTSTRPAPPTTTYDPNTSPRPALSTTTYHARTSSTSPLSTTTYGSKAKTTFSTSNESDDTINVAPGLISWLSMALFLLCFL